MSKLNHSINQKIKNKEPLGQGVEGVVFEISSDWLIKIPKLLYYVCNWSRPLFFKKSYASLLLLADSGFIALEDEFEGRNFGQKIALNPYNISIMKRVRGEPVRLTNDFSHQGAQDYLNLIREISNLPEEAFEEYFKDINILCNKGYSIDYNPHNLLFDREEKRLNVIDFIKSQESSSNSQMIAAIVDFDYMPLYYQFLNIDEKKELLYLLKIIYDRITKIKGNIDGYIKNVNKIPKWIMHPLVLIAEFPELIDINEADIVTAVQKVQDEHNKIDDEIRNAELNRLIEYNKKFKPEKRI
ncbi:MAG: hypothetical protein LBJ74_04320 [Heliobacteriaceae bacterium]|jgi:uncharacterized protein YdcH (DUF465 family)|nr:hypothetical protein [Heliobacteriaceae bacterium]